MIYITLGILGFIFWFGFRLADSMSRFTQKTIWVELWEEFLWAIPIYGTILRGRHIKKQMGDIENGYMMGYSKSYSYEEIRKGNLYNEVGKQMLPGLSDFIGINVFIPAFPTLLYLAVCFIGGLFGGS